LLTLPLDQLHCCSESFEEKRPRFVAPEQEEQILENNMKQHPGRETKKATHQLLMLSLQCVSRWEETRFAQALVVARTLASFSCPALLEPFSKFEPFKKLRKKTP
jgi:hypothetical protein